MESISLKYDEDSSLLMFMNRTLLTVNSEEPLIEKDQQDLSELN